MLQYILLPLVKTKTKTTKTKNKINNENKKKFLTMKINKNKLTMKINMKINDKLQASNIFDIRELKLNMAFIYIYINIFVTSFNKQKN